MMNTPSPFHLLVICRSSPYAGSRISAGFDLLLTAASFEQKVTVCFMGEGLTNLLAVSAESPAVKNPAKAIGAFELYGVNELLVIDEELASRNMDVNDFDVDLRVVNFEAVSELVRDADQVMVY